MPFELPLKGEYFADIPKNDILRTNCGRAAILFAAKDANIHTLYAPYMTCEESFAPLKSLNINIKFYHLNDDLTPKNIEPKNGEGLLWVNYYGNATDEQTEKVFNISGGVYIIDNCHAFFSSPIVKSDGDKKIYNCYSCRKFFGVTDGGYLIAPNAAKYGKDLINARNNYGYLLKSLVLGANEEYSNHLANEKRFETEENPFMNKLTLRILKSFDYAEIKAKRQRNFLRLHKNLKDLNEFPANTSSDTHLFYPLLIFNDKLKEKLVEQRVYVPTLWRRVFDICDKTTLEYRLSKYLVFLPIDQRYSEKDMDDLSEIVRAALDETKVSKSPLSRVAKRGGA